MKVFKNVICGLCVVLGIWIFISFCDVVADNSKPNPEHKKNNFFSIITDTTYEKSAVVDSYYKEKQCFVLLDTDGNEWFYEGELDVGENVMVKFDSMKTDTIYDDEIVNIKGSLN